MAPGLWKELPRCKKLADSIRKEQGVKSTWTYLDAPQLLKHTLGLTKTLKGKDEFALLYLWYDIDSVESHKHKNEIALFREYIGQEVAFKVATYQDVFHKISELSNVDTRYLSYITDRYIAKE